MYTKSVELHKEALEHIVGGVNSPSRSYKAVGGGSPVAMEKANGAYFWDVDGNQYIDYLAAYGRLLPDMPIRILLKRLKQRLKTACCTGRRPNMRSLSPKC